MIQDIAPHKYYVDYKPQEPTGEDILLIFNKGKLLVREEKDETGVRTWFPAVDELEIKGEIVFLFKMDETNLFMTESGEEYEGWHYVGAEYFRTAYPMWKAFAGATALQLYRWYSNNKFCSRCGSPLERGNTERSLVCRSCGRTVYPTISPCVIVALTDGDKLLLTKYNPSHSSYTRYALIAGYAEVGETFEDAVAREVMEEVGLRATKITYYKNQPWAFSDTILMGFFAQVEGSKEIVRDESELSEAVWLKREDIPPCNSAISLTNEMIEKFRLGEIK